MPVVLGKDPVTFEIHWTPLALNSSSPAAPRADSDVVDGGGLRPGGCSAARTRRRSCACGSRTTTASGSWRAIFRAGRSRGPSSTLIFVLRVRTTPKMGFDKAGWIAEQVRRASYLNGEQRYLTSRVGQVKKPYA